VRNWWEAHALFGNRWRPLALSLVYLGVSAQVLMEAKRLQDTRDRHAAEAEVRQRVYASLLPRPLNHPPHSIPFVSHSSYLLPLSPSLSLAHPLQAREAAERAKHAAWAAAKKKADEDARHAAEPTKAGAW